MSMSDDLARQLAASGERYRAVAAQIVAALSEPVDDPISLVAEIIARSISPVGIPGVRRSIVVETRKESAGEPITPLEP